MNSPGRNMDGRIFRVKCLRNASLTEAKSGTYSVKDVIYIKIKLYGIIEVDLQSHITQCKAYVHICNGMCAEICFDCHMVYHYSMHVKKNNRLMRFVKSNNL